MGMTVIERPAVVTAAETSPGPVSRAEETWAASRARSERSDKEAMAGHFADHDFLLEDGADPSGPRETAASILVNQGTSPNDVVHGALGWISEHVNDGPFHLTWFSPGFLVPATLFEFRQRNPHLSAATHVHLFPGTVDIQLQAQIGAEALRYAASLRRRFSYMILSGHSFDLETGEVGFHFDKEIEIQRTCALLKAKQKFLFFDSHKFSGEGEPGYNLQELLATSDAVTMYTVSGPDSARIRSAFDRLSEQLLTADVNAAESRKPKTLRLTIVGRDTTATEALRCKGFLRKAGA